MRKNEDQLRKQLAKIGEAEKPIVNSENNPIRSGVRAFARSPPDAS